MPACGKTAARALDAFDGSQAAAALVGALADPELSVRRAATEVLADRRIARRRRC